MRIAQEALTFDDVLLLPAHSTVLPRDVDLRSQLTREIELRIPLLSAAMDTVTESRLAIALAQEGGIGIVHKNLTSGEQAAEVQRVKKFESGVIKDPITVTSSTSIRDVIELTRANNISGVPVVDGDDLVGIVTSRDRRFETNLDQPGDSSVMTPKEKLVTVTEGAWQGGGGCPAAQAPHRARAGDQRQLQAARHDHGQGYPEVHRLPECLQG